MPIYINRVTSEVVVQEAGGLSQEQMTAIVQAVIEALEEQNRQESEVQRATEIRENSRPETLFE